MVKSMRELMARLRRTLVGLLLGLLALPALSAGLSFGGGTVSYQTDNNMSTVTLRAAIIDYSCNPGVSGRSGSIRLRLWAFPRPFTGPETGYVLAEYTLNPLSCNYRYNDVSSGSVTFNPPPDGLWYVTLFVEEYENGWAWTDKVNFNEPLRIGGGGGGGGTLKLEGEVSYQSSGETVVLKAGRISYTCGANAWGTSGSIRLTLWAFPQPHSGSERGYQLASYQLDPLSCGYHYNNPSSGSVSYSLPPNGTWYYTLFLEEYGSNSSWSWVDKRNFSSPVIIGPTDPGNACTSVRPNPDGSTVHEFHHRNFDHYFITANAAEVQSLANNSASGWCFTGRTFRISSVPAGGLSPVCRFFSGTYFAPKSSHFYTANAAECQTVRTLAAWRYESDAFYATNPAADGNCPFGKLPLYRLYNNGRSGAPNHRYTTDRALQTEMVNKGWMAEGIGPNRVMMCVG